MVTPFSYYPFQFFIILILCVKNAMPYNIFLIALAKTKGAIDFYNCFQINSISSTKQRILGKNVKIRDFHYFLFEPPKIFNPSVKDWRSYGCFPCCHGNCHLILYSVVFEGIEERIWFIYFSGSLIDSLCSLCLFFREMKRKALIGNDDVIKLMTSQHGNVT